jgi:xylulokinase
MEKLLLGVDVGTTNVKSVLFSIDGSPLAYSEGCYETYHPSSNCAEQEAEEWWNATADTIKEVVSKVKHLNSEIMAICVSSQSPTMLPIDSNGMPLRRGLIWADRRSVKETQWIVDYFGGPEKYQSRFGCAPDSFYLLPKLIWYKNNEPDLFHKTKTILLTNGYINYKLTGVVAIDKIQAISATMAYNINSNDWDNEVERVTGIPLHDIMPPIYQQHEVIGGVSALAAERTGLKKDTPVVCGTADGIANILEVGITKMGDAADITGTSTMFFASADQPAPPKSTVITLQQNFDIPDVPYMLLGASSASGASLKWYRNAFHHYLEKERHARGIKNVYKLLDDKAETSCPGSQGLLYFPYLSGERCPHWNSYLRGMFVGLTPTTKEEDIIRSILEGVAFSTRNLMDETIKNGGVVKRIRATGGAANSNIWLQIKASVLKMPLEVSTGIGGAPLGDALIAGYGVGLFKDFVQAVNNFQKIDAIVEPIERWMKIYDEIYPIFTQMSKQMHSELYDLSQALERIKQF